MKNINRISQQVSDRPFTLDSSQPFVNEMLKEQFLKNEEKLAYIEANQYAPLNIVLMGEVKAGKSTLLNAIVGEAISNVGVTETTAVILEVVYGENKKATIHYISGENEEIEIETLYELLEEKKNEEDTEFFSRITSITLNYPLPRLKELRIVDTPGVETITTENQDTTNDYIMESDVVLWVLSAHHIGQASIIDRIQEVKNQGKPIVLIINRVDQVSGDVDRLIDYVEDEYFMYVEEVFTLSAIQAFEGVSKNDQRIYKESGLQEIMEFLEENIERSSEAVKHEVLLNSLKQVIVDEVIFNKAVQQQLELFVATSKKRKEESNFAVNKIDQLIDDHYSHWIDYQFLKQEEDEVMSVALENKDELASNKLKNFLSQDYIKEQIEEMWQDLNHEIAEERKYALETIDKQIQEETKKLELEFNQFTNQYNLVDAAANSTHSAKDSLIEGAKSGAVVGGTTTFALATYAAVLGPYASIITLGSAFTAFLPPVLFTSVIVGVAYKFLNKEKKENELPSKIIHSFSQAKDQAKKILKKPVQELKQTNRVFFDETNKNMDVQTLGEFSLKEVAELSRAIESHLVLLESISRELQVQIDALRIEENE